MTKMSFKGYQQSLMNAGFGLPKYGADGYWGAETANASMAWADSKRDIEVYQEGYIVPPDELEYIVPADWMPDCDMDKIIVHWTAGAHTASENDREHYHILIEGDGRLVRGKYSIKANVSTSDADGYAAHTKGCNTKSIGVSVCCMAGAVESPFSSGKYPMIQEQWETMAHVVADLIRKYGIPLDKTHVMGHGCVQANLGIVQEGKWDPCKLPWGPGLSLQQADADFRDEVERYL